MSNPFLSVIVPVYNVEPYLTQCLDSILSQTFADFEVILVDDGSTDGSGALCDSYAEKDGRFLCIHKENGGLVSARQAGFPYAKANTSPLWTATTGSPPACMRACAPPLKKPARKRSAAITPLSQKKATSFAVLPFLQASTTKRSWKSMSIPA